MFRKTLSTLTALALFMGISASAFAQDAVTTGTLIVNQLGALGTVNVAGPSASVVTVATQTNATAAVGSYSVTVTAPAGFVLDKVKDGANTVLVTPFTQALAAGATITFNVSFVAAPVVPPVVPPVATEITKQMIKDKTALCAAMEGGKDKKACMKERNVMKKAFQKQEKAKRELARKEAKMKREALKAEKKKAKEALKAEKEKAKEAIEAKAAACEALAAGADKDTCLADLAALKLAFKNTYGRKSDDSDRDSKKGKGHDGDEDDDD